jgi:hypothetical protein
MEPSPFYAISILGHAQSSSGASIRARGAALVGVLQQVGHQRRRHRLPTDRFPFLVQQDQALSHSQ